MATTRRLPPQDEKWTHTKITTRPPPLKEPRDERVKFPRPMGGGGGSVAGRRPTPLDVRLAQAKGSVRLEPGETLREPEVVDFAAAVPMPWPSRMPPPPPPPPPKRMPSWQRGVASRGSELSFGILDYYIRDSPPMQSPEVVSCVGDPAVGRFDFGLPAKAVLMPVDARSGANEVDDDDEIYLTPLSPRPLEEKKPEQHAKKYSLFPTVKDTSPSAHRLARVISDSPSRPRTSTETTSPPPNQTPSTTPPWRPRLLSGAKITTPTPTSTRPRASISPPTPTTTTLRHPTHSTTTTTPQIPLRILSTSSTSTAPTSRSSSSTSPGSSAQKPLLSRSRWSEETVLASPGVARVSFGSLVGRAGAVGEGRAVVHPACFFEDDEEDDGEGEELLWGRGRGGGRWRWRWGWLGFGGCCGRGR